MTELRLIFAKDLRRLRWPLAAWLLITASGVVLRSVAADLALTANVLEVMLGNLMTLLGLVDVLLLVVLVSWLIHDEPLVSADAFWLTRPIRPTMLMLTKLAFAAIWLVLAPVLVQSIATAVVTRDVRHALASLPSIGILQLLWVTVLVTLATLTASVSRFLLTLVAVVVTVTFTVSGFITTFVLARRINGPRDTMLTDGTTGVLVACLVVVVAALVMISQYRQRQRRRSIVTGVAAAVAGALLVAVWPWRFAKPAEPDPGAWTRDSAVALVLDRAVTPYINDPFGVRRPDDAEKQVAVPIHLTGLPATYATAMSIHGTLTFADGSAIDSAQMGDANVQSSESADNVQRPVHAALAPARSLARSPRFGAGWPVALLVSDADLARRGTEPGRLTLAVNVLLKETRLVASLPLVEGSTTRAGRRFEVRRAVIRPGRCVVLIRQIGGVGQELIPPTQFVLRNTRRSEFVFGDMAPAGTGQQLGLLSVFATATASRGAGGFSDFVAGYPSRSGEPPDLDADWLRDADIAILDTTYRGHLSRTLTVDGFRMRR